MNISDYFLAADESSIDEYNCWAIFAMSEPKQPTPVKETIKSVSGGKMAFFRTAENDDQAAA